MKIYVVSIVVGQQVLIHVCKELMENSKHDQCKENEEIF